METPRISLPPPITSSPLKRQIGVSVDGLPLSPLALTRSTSGMSHSSDTCEEKTRKQVAHYKFFLGMEVTLLEKEIRGLCQLLATAKPKIKVELLEKKMALEKDLAILHRKMRKAESLLDAIRDLD